MEKLVMNEKEWNGKTVLITGHTGFKGSWLSLWLQKLKADVIGYSKSIPTKPSLFELANIVVISRPGWELPKSGEIASVLEQRKVNRLDEITADTTGKVLLRSFIPLEISSSYIRKLIKANKSARYLLPDEVWTYVCKHGLYHS